MPTTIEPSACAGFPGLEHIAQERSAGFPSPDENSIHVVRATGGAMVPDEEKLAQANESLDKYYKERVDRVEKEA